MRHLIVIVIFFFCFFPDITWSARSCQASHSLTPEKWDVFLGLDRRKIELVVGPADEMKASRTILSLVMTRLEEKKLSCRYDQLCVFWRALNLTRQTIEELSQSSATESERNEQLAEVLRILIRSEESASPESSLRQSSRAEQNNELQRAHHHLTNFEFVVLRGIRQGFATMAQLTTLIEASHSDLKQTWGWKGTQHPEHTLAIVSRAIRGLRQKGYVDFYLATPTGERGRTPRVHIATEDGIRALESRLDANKF